MRYVGPPMSGPSPTTPDLSVPRAVFLSYAREDTAAASRVADALRSHGVEVWFDQSELRGGDAWDQKIRRQIKDCALFLPVISSNTQARGEGYFRLEWKLAVERTHLMAEGVPFVLPIAVDATSEGSAIVPAEFLRVQWVRLPGALPTPQFVEQVRRMIETPAKAGAPAAERHTGPVPSGKRGSAWLIGSLLAASVAAVVAALLLRRPAESVPVARASAPAPVAAVEPKSIAVLPFENMSEDKQNAFFADGVHEDVLTNLSFVKDLHVVSRTSVMQYRGTTKSIKEIGKELGVAYVLEGSVRREGNKVRVTGQLIDARTDEHVWAKAYDRDLTDIFAIQGELAQAIADAMKTVLSPDAKALIARRPTENTAAYDNYIKARSSPRDGIGMLAPSIALLREAVRLDPTFAEAWGELGSRLAFNHFAFDMSQATLDEATRASDTALRLAPDDPVVIETRGDYYYYGFRDYERAIKEYLRLAELRPNDPLMYRSLGLIHRRQGRLAEAQADFQAALKLEPKDDGFRYALGEVLWAGGRAREARLIYKKLVEDYPDVLQFGWRYAEVAFSADGSTAAIDAFASRKVPEAEQALFIYLQSDLARTCGRWTEFIRLRKLQRYFEGDSDNPKWEQDAQLADGYANAGDMDSARSVAQESASQLKAELERQPENAQVWAYLGLVQALLGEREEALRSAAKSRELLPESKDHLLGPFMSNMAAETLAWCGEKDRALSEIKRLLRTPFGIGAYESAVMFRPLREDPRFQAMLADPANQQPVF